MDAVQLYMSLCRSCKTVIKKTVPIDIVYVRKNSSFELNNYWKLCYDCRDKIKTDIKLTSSTTQHLFNQSSYNPRLT